jgi:23S rRNA pseudouridine1911/1915/1917 synthase
MTRLNETWKVAVEGTALATELHARLKISHRQAKGLIDAGCVKIQGQAAHSYGTRLKVDEELEVSFDPDMVYTALPRPSKSSDSPFEILWEDKHLVFVNKPAGLLTVPAEKHHDPCLAEALTDHYRRRGFKRFHLFIAHRLDRYTSGVLVFAKTPEALNGLKNIFEEHHLRRIYIAILAGELPENAGTLSDKLVERKSLKMTVVPENSKAKHDVKGAKLAVTHYRVLERLPGHTVVEVKLETGRRNQIRVQFAERGFPLLGDQVYGVPSDSIDRQALHAELLGFRHPVTEETVTISAPMPADMENVLKALRNARRVVRAEAGVTGEADLYKPKITKARKVERRKRSERFSEPEAAQAPTPRGAGSRPGSGPRTGAGPRSSAKGASSRPGPAQSRPGSGSPRPRPAGKSSGAPRKASPKKPS